jgi:hypothetical protein
VHEIDDADVAGIGQRGTKILRLRCLSPLEPDVDDVGRVGARHRGPALAEVAGGEHEHPVARRNEVRERGLERARPGGGEHEDVVASAVDLLEPGEAALVDDAKIAAAVMHHRLGERGEHLGRDRRGAGCHQVALFRHAAGA